MNWFERDSWEFAAIFALGLLAIIIRAVYLSGAFTVRKLVKAVLFGGFVGGTAFMIFYDIAAIPPMLRGALIGISTMFAEEIITGLHTLACQYKRDPMTVISKFWPWGGGK